MMSLDNSKRHVDFRNTPRPVGSWSYLAVSLISLGLLLPSGCFKTKFGVPPEINHLQDLSPGQSTEADILIALGEPRGYGNYDLSQYPQKGKIWYYEFAEVQGSQIHLQILLVFIDYGKYQGHLWFSSENLIT